MRTLDLFAGAGGSLYAGLLLGWRCVAAVEKNYHCQRTLKERQSDGVFEPFKVYGDIRKFNGEEWRGKVDIITAGFPCQPFSKLGLRRGSDDKKNMWPDTARCIREVQPEWVFLENVPALLASGYYSTLLSDLASFGFDVTWGLLGADAVGAPHKRNRLWIVGRSLANTNGRREPQRTQGGDQSWDGAEHSCETMEDADSEGGAKRTQSPRREADRSGYEAGWWSVDPATTEPSVGRLAHGVANRRQRLKALGNGWVPQVAVAAWHQLSRRLIIAQQPNRGSK